MFVNVADTKKFHATRVQAIVTYVSRVNYIPTVTIVYSGCVLYVVRRYLCAIHPL